MSVLLCLSMVAHAGDHSSAKDMLQRYDTKSRSRAIAELLRLNDEQAVNVLVNGLRRAFKEDPRRQKTYEKVTKRAHKKVVAALENVAAITAKIRGQRGASNAREKLAKLSEQADEQFGKVAVAIKEMEAAADAIEPHTVLIVGGRRGAREVS